MREGDTHAGRADTRRSCNLLVDSGMAGTCSRYAQMRCLPITTSRLEQRDVGEHRRDQEGRVQGQGEVSQAVYGGVTARGGRVLQEGPGGESEEEHQRVRLGVRYQRQDPQRLNHQVREDGKGHPSQDRRAEGARRGEEAHQGTRERERVPKKQQPSSPGAFDDGLSHASSHWHISLLSVCRKWPTAVVGPEAEMQNLRTVMWRASGMPSWGMF